MESTYFLFGKRFKELREKHNYTQEQLAEFLGVEARQISRIETGKCFTTLDNLEKIANLYKMEIADIFSFGHIQSKKEIIKSIVEMLESANDEDCRKVFRLTKNLIY